MANWFFTSATILRTANWRTASPTDVPHIYNIEIDTFLVMGKLNCCSFHWANDWLQWILIIGNCFSVNNDTVSHIHVRLTSLKSIPIVWMNSLDWIINYRFRSRGGAVQIEWFTLATSMMTTIEQWTTKELSSTHTHNEIGWQSNESHLVWSAEHLTDSLACLSSSVSPTATGAIPCQSLRQWMTLIYANVYSFRHFSSLAW